MVSRRKTRRVAPTKDLRGASGRSPASPASASNRSMTSFDRRTREATSRVIKYLQDFKSPADIKALNEEGYEIDYDRLVGVGTNSAVFLGHLINSPAPPLDKNGRKPLYTPGYDMAVKVVVKKWIDSKRPLKTRTGNLKLALALGKTDAENNILKVIDVFKTPERIFLFMQYCAYGNVISFIRRNGRVPERLAQRWSSQMAVSLAFIHRFHIAHRNYKLENVLIDENLNAKLTGFGLSKFCIDLVTKQPLHSKTICGSEPYLAPEMLRESVDRSYDPKLADVWAFGVGVFLCFTKRYPFEADNLRALKQEQVNGKYLDRDTKKRLRTPVRNLLNAIFVVEPSERPQMQDLISRSSWLNFGNPELSKPRTPVSPQAPRTGKQTTTIHDTRQTRLTKRPAPDMVGRLKPDTSNQPAQADNSTSQSRSLGKETKYEDLAPITPQAYQAEDALPYSSQRIDKSNVG